MFKNMKIEINDQQPLDEVVRELERLGYVKFWFYNPESYTSIITTESGLYTGVKMMFKAKDNKIVTLTELKNME